MSKAGTSPPDSPERSQWRAGVYGEAYMMYVAGEKPRRTPLIGKRAIY